MARKNPTSISDQLRDAIEQSEMSRYQIAKETGVDAASLCRFAAGQVGLTLQNIDRIGRVLGLRIVVDKPASRKGK
jgi:plasmid maintenance system antidote protein VapI